MQSVGIVWDQIDVKIICYFVLMNPQDFNLINTISIKPLRFVLWNLYNVYRIYILSKHWHDFCYGIAMILNRIRMVFIASARF